MLLPSFSQWPIFSLGIFPMMVWHRNVSLQILCISTIFTIFYFCKFLWTKRFRLEKRTSNSFFSCCNKASTINFYKSLFDLEIYASLSHYRIYFSTCLLFCNCQRQMRNGDKRKIQWTTCKRSDRTWTLMLIGNTRVIWNASAISDYIDPLVEDH